jgi:NADP-dependent 3-hydroxy acid dehydrogenase YdfG
VKAITPNIDIIFVNAGIGKFNSVDQMTEEMYDEIMDINFKGRLLYLAAVVAAGK